MSVIHLRRNDATVAAIIGASFPQFTGQKVEAHIQSTVRFIGTYWDEGSKRDYAVVRLADLRCGLIPDEQHGTGSTAHDLDYPIPQGMVVVCHSRWGQREHVEIIGPASNLTPMLDRPADLTEDERTVLIATRSLKASYGGIKDFRFVEASRRRGITRDRWDAAKANLIARKFLNKMGAITVEGRNAVGNEQL